LARDPIAVAARCDTNGERLNLLLLLLRERIVPVLEADKQRHKAVRVREWSAARHVAAGEPETRSGRRQVIDLQILGLQLRRRDGSAARSPVAPPMDRGVSVHRFSRFCC
jgi:hypothetical protein